MTKKYTFTEEEKQEIREYRENNRDKRIEKRLEALEMRAEGKRNKEISEKTGFHTQYITVLVSRYKTKGEEQILEPFRKAAKEGKLIAISEIEKTYREAVGHSIGTAQIYYVLHRHGWRKIMPRSKHPKKASEEVIEASKKLTLE